MTPLTKPVVRLVTGKHVKDLVVTLDHDGVTFRIKGTRTAYTLPYQLGMFYAARLVADERIAARKKVAR